MTYLLGFRFAPRIRDLSDVKLFTLNKCDKFSNLDGILKGKINEDGTVQVLYDLTGFMAGEAENALAGIDESAWQPVE